jgi:hypothetical protein
MTTLEQEVIALAARYDTRGPEEHTPIAQGFLAAARLGEQAGKDAAIKVCEERMAEETRSLVPHAAYRRQRIKGAELCQDAIRTLPSELPE